MSDLKLENKGLETRKRSILLFENKAFAHQKLESSIKKQNKHYVIRVCMFVFPLSMLTPAVKLTRCYKRL